MSTNPISSPYSCCTWNIKSQIISSTVGAAAIAAIVAGFALAFFFHKPPVEYATAFCIGGGLLIADLLYVLIVKCKQHKQERMQEQLANHGFIPTQIPLRTLAAAAFSLSRKKVDENVKVVVNTVVDNWNQAKTHHRTNNWTLKQLEEVLALDEKYLLPLLERAKIQIPQNGTVTTRVLDRAILQLKTELGL